MTRPTPPLEWHPWYRDKTWLLDWVEGRSGPRDHIRIPVPQRLAAGFVEVDETYPTMPNLREVIMTRRKAWGPAPYVGRPFGYAWWVGVDNLGRQIAGESRIVYTDELHY